MQQIMDGLKLMLAGMGTVFTFLIVMIIWIVLAAKVTAKYAHLLPETPVTSPRKSVKSPSTVDDDEENNNLIVAVTSAIHQFQKDRKNRR